MTTSREFEKIRQRFKLRTGEITLRAAAHEAGIGQRTAEMIVAGKRPSIFAREQLELWYHRIETHGDLPLAWSKRALQGMEHIVLDIVKYPVSERHKALEDAKRAIDILLERKLTKE